MFKKLLFFFVLCQHTDEKGNFNRKPILSFHFLEKFHLFNNANELFLDILYEKCQFFPTILKRISACEFHLLDREYQSTVEMMFSLHHRNFTMCNLES